MMRRLLLAILLSLPAYEVRAQIVTGGVTSSGGGGGSTSPGGSDTYCQFNDASSFGGDSGCTYNKTTDLLTAFNITATTAFKNSALTSGRLVFSGAAGVQSDDADLTFATDTLTVAKIVGSTSITNSALTAGRLVLSGTAGLESDDADLSFLTDTLTATKMAPTLFTSTFDVANADTTVARFGAGQLSVEGVEVPTISSSSTLSNKTLSTATLTTGQSFIVGASTLGVVGASTVLTPDGPILYTGTTPNSWHIKEFGDAAHDSNNGSCGTSSCTDPTLIIHSHNQTTTEWMDLKHNGTYASIATGVGPLTVPGGTAGTAAGLAFNDATTLGFATRNSNKIDVISGANTIVTMGSGLAGANGLIVVGAHMLQFNNTAGGTPDLNLVREGAAILQLGADVNGAAVAQTIKAHDGITGTDIAGANITISGGTGTGTGAGGNFITQTSPSLATGTTQQTAASRMVQVAKPKALTAGAATSVVLFAVASSTVGGGEIEYTVTANDSTDFQIRAGRVGYVMVNKGGAETCKVFGIDSVLGVAGTENPTQTQDASGIGAMSAGTLTYTWGTDVTGTNTCALTLNAASSLTETTLEIAYTVFRQHGTGAITPQ